MAEVDKTVIITGGNSGLGFEAARAILQDGDGWHVVIAGRSRQRCEEATGRLRHETGTPSVDAMVLELASLAAVRQFAAGLFHRRSAATASTRVQRRRPDRPVHATDRRRLRVHLRGQPPRPFPAGEPDAPAPESSCSDHLRQQRYARPGPAVGDARAFVKTCPSAGGTRRRTGSRPAPWPRGAPAVHHLEAMQRALHLRDGQAIEGGRYEHA